MKKYIIIGILLLIVIITGIMSITSIKNMDTRIVDDTGIVTQNQIVYINVGSLLKIEYEESFKACSDLKTSMICSPITTNVTNMEYLNTDAESIYYNYNYNNKDIYDVIEDIINIAYDNNYDTSNVDLIYTSGNFISSNINVSPLVNITDSFQDSIDKQSVIRHYKNTFLITFDTDGGSNVLTQSVNKNNTVIKPEDPIMNGYEFVEWQLNGKTYNFDTPVTSDITLKAVWLENEKIEIKHIVTFNSNGGTKIKKQTVIDGEFANEPKDPTKKGHIFMGWTLDGEQFDFNSSITSDITLDANWATVKKN